MSQGVQSRGILVPQRAVSRDERGRPTVLVVGAKDMAELRVIAGRPHRRRQLARDRRSQAGRQGDRRRRPAGPARHPGEARAVARPNNVAFRATSSTGRSSPGCWRSSSCLFGLLSIRSLPIAQFPALAPPQISVTAIYPGADATTLDKTTTQIIEQQLQGIDHLRYFSSQSSSSGTVAVTLTFEQGTDPDTAQVQVNNKVQAALPLLPQEVQRQGVRVEKSSANFALVPGLYSADNSHDQFDLADMMASKIQEPVSRINGVGGFQLFGSQYAMRIWVDPMKLNSYQLTMADVTSAVQAQNAQVSAGQLGNLPAPVTQQLNATVSVQSRLQTPEQFGAIRLKTSADGSVVRLRDVARVELGSEGYGFSAKYSGHPATAAAIRLAPGRRCAQDHRRGEGEDRRDLEDNSRPTSRSSTRGTRRPFVKVSLKQVVETLFEAMVLVFLVMFLFLQNIARDPDPDHRHSRSSCWGR